MPPSKSNWCIVARKATAALLLSGFPLREGVPRHKILLGSEQRAEAIAEIRNLANELDEEVWLEKIRFDTSPPADHGETPGRG